MTNSSLHQSHLETDAAFVNRVQLRNGLLKGLVEDVSFRDVDPLMSGRIIEKDVSLSVLILESDVYLSEILRDLLENTIF